MVTVVRGDVILCDFNPVIGTEQAGIRPALVVQIDRANTVSPHTIIVSAWEGQNPRLEAAACAAFRSPLGPACLSPWRPYALLAPPASRRDHAGAPHSGAWCRGGTGACPGPRSLAAGARRSPARASLPRA